MMVKLAREGRQEKEEHPEHLEVLDRLEKAVNEVCMIANNQHLLLLINNYIL